MSDDHAAGDDVDGTNDMDIFPVRRPRESESSVNTDTTTLTLMLTAEPTLTRLIEEEEELRRISPTDGALGKNGSDYRNMYDLFLQVVEPAKTLRMDPKAFINRNGEYNDKMLGAYTRMMGTAIKALGELNKMRNNDKMIAHILDTQTRELVQAAAIEIGVYLKRVIENLDRTGDQDEAIIEIKRLMYRELPQIFIRAAASTLSSAKEEFGLTQN